MRIWTLTNADAIEELEDRIDDLESEAMERQQRLEALELLVQKLLRAFRRHRDAERPSA